MDGRRSLLRSLWVLNYWDPSRFQEISGVFQEFLCQALFAYLALVLFFPALYVRVGPVTASFRSRRRVQRTVLALVGLFCLPAKLSGSDPDAGNRIARCHLVSRS